MAAKIETPSHANRLFCHRAAPVCALDDGRLAGLRHRTVIDHRGGSAALALWHEEHLPGFHVPLHRHDCEEIITVLRGRIEASIDGEFIPVGPQESILIPSGALHGFRVTSRRPIRLLALFASSDPKILREDGTEAPPPWEGGSPKHLDA